MKSLIIKGSIWSQQKSDEVGTCQCREGLHALPQIIFVSASLCGRDTTDNQTEEQHEGSLDERFRQAPA